MNKKGLTTKFFGALKMSPEEAEEWKSSIKKNREKPDEELKKRTKQFEKMNF